MHNRIRQNPKVMITHLEKCLTRFQDGNILMNEEGTSGIETYEGKDGYLEGIEYLRKMKPLQPYRWAP